jgi:hypothetical protein
VSVRESLYGKKAVPSSAAVRRLERRNGPGKRRRQLLRPALRPLSSAGNFGLQLS